MLTGVTSIVSGNRLFLACHLFFFFFSPRLIIRPIFQQRLFRQLRKYIQYIRSSLFSSVILANSWIIRKTHAKLLLLLKYTSDNSDYIYAMISVKGKFKVPRRYSEKERTRRPSAVVRHREDLDAFQYSCFVNRIPRSRRLDAIMYVCMYSRFPLRWQTASRARPSCPSSCILPFFARTHCVIYCACMCVCVALTPRESTHVWAGTRDTRVCTWRRWTAIEDV